MTTNNQQDDKMREQLGRMRVVYTDNHQPQKDVWAHIGPIGNHTSFPEFQDAIELVAMAFNMKHGHLSANKFKELSERKEPEAYELLRIALASRAQPDLIPQLERWKARCIAAENGHPQVRESNADLISVIRTLAESLELVIDEDSKYWIQTLAACKEAVIIAAPFLEGR